MQLIDPKPKQWSRAEYYQMAQLGWFEGQRAELIGGEIITLNPQKSLHAYTLDKVAEVLSRNYSPDVFFVPRHFLCWDDDSEGLIRRTTPPFPHCLIIFSKPVNC